MRLILKHLLYLYKELFLFKFNLANLERSRYVMSQENTKLNAKPSALNILFNQLYFAQIGECISISILDKDHTDSISKGIVRQDSQLGMEFSGVVSNGKRVMGFVPGNVSKSSISHRILYHALYFFLNVIL